MGKMERTSILLPPDYLREIDSIAKEQGLDRASLIRQLLINGIREYKVKLAVELYRAEKISIGKATEIAGVSIWEMSDILKEQKIPLAYRISDAREEIKKILKQHKISNT
jgi:predicted HTH domain antitoxin